MSQKHNQEDIKDFISGLKIVIRNSWPTQEEFAKGVTSKVNLSNILRETGGTSLKMRQALAKKAGMDIDEIIALGRKANGKDVEVSKPVRSASATKPEEIFFGGSAMELSTQANELTLKIQAEMADYVKAMTGMLNHTVSERDKLLKFLAQEQTITNSLPMGIKVVNRDMQIVYVNRALMEQFQITVGDTCSPSDCVLCVSSGSLAKEVFTKGTVAHRLVKIENQWYCLAGYPIQDASWIVSKVIIVTSPAMPWIQLMVERGWIKSLEELS